MAAVTTVRSRKRLVICFSMEPSQSRKRLRDRKSEEDFVVRA
jgi:hypothetical protein